MRRYGLLLIVIGMVMLALAPAASAAIHPIVCSGNAGVPNGLDGNPARESTGDPASSDIGNPPGLTPDSDFATDPDHADDLTAGDGNPTGRNAFAPLAAQGFDDTRPNWFKTCGP